jgi:hypothetical protein
MPTETRERTLAEIESDLAKARVELAAAEEAEQDASERVTEAREAVGLGSLARRGLLLVQRSLANRQEDTEILRLKVRNLERSVVQQTERAAVDRARAAGERAAAIRDQNAALERWIGRFLHNVATGAAAIEQEVANMKANGGSVADIGRLLAWQQVRGNVDVLRRMFPLLNEPKAITTEKEIIPNVS